jgi:predicted kinase
MEIFFMNKAILICGKICAGKTTYAKKIANDINAVILSVDEITLALFGQYIGTQHDEMIEKAEKYLYKKAVEIISKGIDVILDWGFWVHDDRQFATKYFNDLGIKVEWHYVEVDNINWQKYLSKRNNEIKNNMENYYFIDEVIAEKFWNLFEEPQLNEIDVWYDNNMEIHEET